MNNVFRVFDNSFWANGSTKDTHFHNPLRIQFSGFFECKRVVLGCSADFLGATENGHKADSRRIIFDVEKSFNNEVQTSLSKRQFLKEKSFINNLGEGAGVTLITFHLDLHQLRPVELSQEGAILPPSSQARLNILLYLHSIQPTRVCTPAKQGTPTVLSFQVPT